MNYNLLYYFKVLGELEHFGKAAKILHIEQPSLSQSMKRLESELGVPLFERRGRNISLTEHARTYHQRVSECFALLEGAEKAFLEDAKIETIVISAVHLHLGSKLSKDVSAFLSDPSHQHIKISIFERHSKDSLEALQNGQCDLIICSYKNPEYDFTYIPLYRHQSVLIVPKGHPLAKHNELDMKDALQYEFIYPCAGTGMRANFDRIFTEMGEKPPFALEAESVNLSASMVANNFGIAVIPDINLAHHVNIKKIALKNSSSKFYHYLAYHRVRPIPKAAQLFCEFLSRENNPHIH